MVLVRKMSMKTSGARLNCFLLGSLQFVTYGTVFAGPLGPVSAETGARMIHTLLE